MTTADQLQNIYWLLASANVLLIVIAALLWSIYNRAQIIVHQLAGRGK